MKSIAFKKKKVKKERKKKHIKKEQHANGNGSQIGKTDSSGMRTVKPN